jgi:hypothetical protein
VKVTDDTELKFIAPEDTGWYNRSRFTIVGGYWHMPELVEFAVGFCGKLYTGLALERSFDYFQFFYAVNDFKGLDEAIDDRRYELLKEELNKPAYSKIKKETQLGRAIRRMKGIDQHDITEYAIETRVPYFFVRPIGRSDNKYRYEITNVPELKKLNFQTVKDPYTAMQELSMFIGGVIPRQAPEMVNISDKDRIAQHGFDKFSFRHPVK